MHMHMTGSCMTLVHQPFCTRACACVCVRCSMSATVAACAGQCTAIRRSEGSNSSVSSVSCVYPSSPAPVIQCLLYALPHANHCLHWAECNASWCCFCKCFVLDVWRFPVPSLMESSRYHSLVVGCFLTQAACLKLRFSCDAVPWFHLSRKEKKRQVYAFQRS